MDSDLKKLYARAFDTPGGRCFCVVVSGPDVGDEGFDMTVFHARSMRTYIGKGLRAPPRWIKPDLWMPLALRALASDAQPEGVRFNFNPETGSLSWTWPAREVGMSAGAQQAVALRLVEPGAAAGSGADASAPGEAGGAPLEAMMGTVWESCYRLLLSCRQLDSQLQRQGDALSRTRRELQECTEKHKALVQELHVKFARVLDAKKEKLIEQQERIRDLEEQLKAAKQELAEAEAAHTDDEEEAEPEPYGGEPLRLGQQQQQPQGMAANASRAIRGPVTAVEPARGPQAAPPTRTIGAMSAGESTAANEPAELQRVATFAGGGGGAFDAPIAADAPRTAPAGMDAHEGMDWEMCGAGARGRPLAPAPAQRAFPLSAAGAAIAAATPPVLLGGTYLSLGSTQIDEDYLQADTQPAVLAAGVAAAPAAGTAPHIPPAPGTTSQWAVGLGDPVGLRGFGAAAVAGVTGGEGPAGGDGGKGLHGGITALDDEDDDEDEDDDAALGLGGRGR